mgnify:CR=1 FL=1
MKPRIVHLLDDQNVGGVRRWIQSISDSRLNTQFDFELVRSTEQLHKPDLVICHNPSSWKRSLNLLKIKLRGIKLVIDEHHYCEGFESLNVPSLSRFRAMLKWNYGIVDRVASVSQGQSDWMRKYQLVQPSKLSTIPLSTQFDHFLEVPKKQLQKPLILGAYGRFSRQKGFDTLLRAMQQVPASKVQLYLGGYGEDESLLKTLAADLSNVKFWGSVQDVPGFLSACDAIVIPSRWEPGGTVCIEAKAAGKPVIVSSVDGLTEQVQDCGMVVPPDDPVQLAMAIDTFINLAPEQIEAWGNNARNSVRNSWEQHVTAWDTFLWNLLGEVR